MNEHFHGISIAENGGVDADTLPFSFCADTARTLAQSSFWAHCTLIGRQIELDGGLKPWYSSSEEFTVDITAVILVYVLCNYCLWN